MKLSVTLLFLILSGSCYCQKNIQQSTLPSITISLSSEAVKSFDSLSIEIKLTNKTSKSQRFLFDKGDFYTGGLWYSFSFDITDNRNSVLDCNNRALLSSVSVKKEEDKLKDFYYSLLPGESITRTFKLSTLVCIKTEKGKSLPKGSYFIRLSNLEVSSNIAVFQII